LQRAYKKTIAHTIGLIYTGPLVLRSKFFANFYTIKDRNQTVLQRSKPSSCTILIGEQPNPWDLFQPQEMIRLQSVRHYNASR
jgi:hypothetical protein